jgi:hypothetical protein
MSSYYYCSLYLIFLTLIIITREKWMGRGRKIAIAEIGEFYRKSK